MSRRPTHHDEPVSPPVAGGLGALRATLHHLRRETGVARGSAVLARVNQAGGFDCPGCAWPEPARRGVFEFCENGAKAVAEEATRRRCTPERLGSFTVDQLRAMSDFELGQLGRLTHPMIVEGAGPGGRMLGHERYRPLSWDDALSLLGGALAELDHPDQAVFYTSGRTSNEAAFLYQLLARALGTNNLPDCSNMCHESSGVGLSQVIGIGKGTVAIDDFDSCDLILVIGQNPGTNHPRMLTTLREARSRGATIVSINPLREAGLVRFAHPQKPLDYVTRGRALASEMLQVRIGGDVALFQALARAVLDLDDAAGGGVLDRDFIAQHTSGFAGYQAALRAADWQRLCRDSGVEPDAIRRVAGLYAGAERVIACWAMGITQHQNGVANVQEIANFMFLRGNLGRPGAGLCPVRGHSNVQGDRTMGITHAPTAGFLERLEAEVPGLRAPRGRGLDTVDAIRAMDRGQVQRVRGHGRQLLLGRARHRHHRASPDLVPGHRPRVNQAQPLASVPRRGRADPAVPGPHRDRRAGARRPVRHGRGFDEHGARLARLAGAGQRHAHERARHRGRPGPRRAAGQPDPVVVAGVRLRSHPRRSSPGWYPGSPTTTRGSAMATASASPRRRASGASPPRPSGPASPCMPSPSWRWRPGGCA